MGSSKREGVPAHVNLSASSMLMIAMQYTSNPGMCKHETWYHFFWDYQSGGIVQCNQKSFDDGKNLCHYPEQDVKWVILVKTWISEHHAGSNHYVDKRSLCDEEIGFDPGLETLIYSCLTSECSVIYNISVGEKYHLPWLQKFIVTVLYDDSNITKFTSGTIFLKKTGNAGCRLNGTIKKIKCNYEYRNKSDAVSVKPLGSQNQIETIFNPSELLHCMTVDCHLSPVICGWGDGVCVEEPHTALCVWGGSHQANVLHIGK